MSTAFPEIVDAWRMVTARRSFQGSLPLAAMLRLAPSLATTEGAVAYTLDFGKDDFGVSYIQVRADAPLILVCQRTLDDFVLPIRIDTRLGLIADERDEAALPAGYEPLLTVDGQLRLADVIEDELILALPVIPVKPGEESPIIVYSDGPEDPVEETRVNPFADLRKDLRKLKKS